MVGIKNICFLSHLLVFKTTVGATGVLFVLVFFSVLQIQKIELGVIKKYMLLIFNIDSKLSICKELETGLSHQSFSHQQMSVTRSQFKMCLVPIEAHVNNSVVTLVLQQIHTIDFFIPEIQLCASLGVFLVVVSL